MGKITERAVTRVAPRFLATAVNGNALQSSSYVGLSLWVTKYSRERAGVIFSCDHKVACCQESASLPGPLHLGIWYLLGRLSHPCPGHHRDAHLQQPSPLITCLDISWATKIILKIGNRLDQESEDFWDIPEVIASLGVPLVLFCVFRHRRWLIPFLGEGTICCNNPTSQPLAIWILLGKPHHLAASPFMKLECFRLKPAVLPEQQDAITPVGLNPPSTASWAGGILWCHPCLSRVHRLSPQGALYCLFTYSTKI